MTSEQLPRHEQLTLAWGFSFDQLQDAQGLQNLEQRFVQYLGELDPDIRNVYDTFRHDPQAMTDQEYARWIIRMGPWVEGFVVKLFNLDLAGLHHSYHRVEDMLWFRKHMVLPVMRKNYQLQSALPTYTDLESWMFAVLTKEQIDEKTLIAYAKQMDESQDLEAIKRIQDWCFWCLSHPESHTSILSWPSFWVPKKRSNRLVEVNCDEDGTTIQSKHIPAYQREDFQFIDTYLDKPNTALQSDYCSFCHDKEVDYCRKGFLQSKKKPDLGFRKSDEGAVLSGCPLDEKISEMHWLKHNHYHLAALVAVMIDNPMCPATGHRICNDCIMSCIYQKQEGVDTPQVETGVLMDILKLPWGVEVYDLLVKWNPLRRVESCPLPPTGQRVLVMGLGPSGFSLMHHLWMRGITVMGVDGASLSLAKPYGLDHPVYDYQSLWQCLSERRSIGFGGVSEYGITVRWDKNFLQLIYLSLSRRQRIGMAGNVRFGGGLRVEDAWRLGFDHLALALGAGLPQALAIPNSLAKGMCQANDFLMSLQLTGAQHTANLASLSMHMPCVVIGGGLTAVDAATEAQAFYLQFIKMIYLRIDALLTHKKKQDFWQAFSDEERGQLEIWYEHGKAMLAYRKKALASGQTIDYSDLLQSWGGVSILYRGALERAPSYRQNASELQAALDQGVSFLAHTTPLAVDTDNAGQVTGLFVTQPWQGEAVCLSEIKVNLLEVVPEYVRWTQESELDQLAEGMVFVYHLDFSGDVYLRVVGVDHASGTVQACFLSHLTQSPMQPLPIGSKVTLRGPFRLLNLPCRQILVATGAKPNTAYEYEHRHTFKRQGPYYALHRWNEETNQLEEVSHFDANRKKTDAFFTSYEQKGKKVSVLGDLHPHYHGSVVKAIASAKHAIDPMVQILPKRTHVSVSNDQEDAWVSGVSSRYIACLRGKREIAKGVFILDVHAPEACSQAEVGHFFRLQRMPEHMPWTSHGYLGSESCSLQMIARDQKKNILRFMLQTVNVRTQVLAQAQVGEKLSCMGPTGVRLKLPDSPETIWLMADFTALGQATFYADVYHSLGHSVSLRLFVDSDEHLRVVRTYWKDFPHLHAQCFYGDLAQNKAVVMNPVQLIDRLLFQGKASFVKTCYQYFRLHYACMLHPHAQVLGSVHGPMQCMLKGICAQCLQWQIDPQTGARTKAVYSCSWQDQPLTLVDLDHAVARTQNSSGLDKLYLQWLAYNELS